MSKRKFNKEVHRIKTAEKTNHISEDKGIKTDTKATERYSLTESKSNVPYFEYIILGKKENYGVVDNWNL